MRIRKEEFRQNSLLLFNSSLISINFTRKTSGSDCGRYMSWNWESKLYQSKSFIHYCETISQQYQHHFQHPCLSESLCDVSKEFLLLGTTLCFLIIVSNLRQFREWLLSCISNVNLKVPHHQLWDIVSAGASSGK